MAVARRSDRGSQCHVRHRIFERLVGWRSPSTAAEDRKPVQLTTLAQNATPVAIALRGDRGSQQTLFCAERARLRPWWLLSRAAEGGKRVRQYSERLTADELRGASEECNSWARLSYARCGTGGCYQSDRGSSMTGRSAVNSSTSTVAVTLWVTKGRIEIRRTPLAVCSHPPERLRIAT